MQESVEDDRCESCNHCTCLHCTCRLLATLKDQGFLLSMKVNLPGPAFRHTLVDFTQQPEELRRAIHSRRQSLDELISILSVSFDSLSTVTLDPSDPCTGPIMHVIPFY